MKLRGRLLALLVLPLAMLFGFAMAGLWLQAESKADGEWADHSVDVLKQSHLLYANLATAESAVRGFGLTHDQALLRTFDKTAAAVPKIGANLQAMVRDSPSQEKRAAASTALAVREITALNDLTERLEAGDRHAFVEAMRNDGLLQTTGPVSGATKAFDEEEERLGDRRRAESVQLWHDVSLFLAIGLVLGCALAIGSISMFGRSTVRRIANLAVTAERLAAGEDIGAPAVGHDEIAHLDRTLHAVASLLAERQESVMRHEVIVARAPDTILVIRLSDGRIIDANKAAEVSTGYTHDELTTMNLNELREPSTLGQLDRLFKSLETADEARFETIYRRKDGTTFPVEVSAQVSWVHGERVIASIIRDTTERKNTETLAIRAKALEIGNEALAQEIVERKRAEEQLSHAAFHDELTGLPNRALFMDRLEQMVARHQRHSDHLSAVLFVDLDRFKFVNDSLGHIVGDLLLIAVARRLEKSLRPGDSLARFGGDEFTLLVDDIDSEHGASLVAQRILTSLEEPFVIGGREVFAPASIGIALSRTGFDKPGDVLRNADIAMYRAKELGKQRYWIFTSELLSRSVAQLELDTDLRRAIERKEFKLFYQPVVSIETNRLIGFEALIRWQHPVRGLILPAEFIAMAEETGRIVQIGLWVLETACRQVHIWQQRYPRTPALTISVNVSARQLGDGGFLSEVKRVIAESEIAPETLHFEITESVLMEDPEIASQTLHSLRELGVHIDLDDFGTGYSSLAYLHRFPISTLKIDRSFISTAGSGVANPEIVQSILALARSLSIQATAEGIETEEQLIHLRSLKCASAQGYYFSRPVNHLAAALLIANGVSPADRPEIGHLDIGEFAASA